MSDPAARTASREARASSRRRVHRMLAVATMVSVPTTAMLVTMGRAPRWAVSWRDRCLVAPR
jgi:hypothetical protein